MRSKIIEAAKRRRKRPVAARPVVTKREATDEDRKERGNWPKGVPIRTKVMPGRNEPCPCGSGEKYKNCHGKAVDQPLRTMQYRDIRSLYTPEQEAAAKRFLYVWGFTPDPTQLRVFMTGTEKDMLELIEKLATDRGMPETLIKGIIKAKRMLSARNRHMWSEKELRDYVDAFRAAGVDLPSGRYDSPQENGEPEQVAAADMDHGSGSGRESDSVVGGESDEIGSADEAGGGS